MTEERAILAGGYTCHFVRPNWRLPRRTELLATSVRVLAVVGGQKESNGNKDESREAILRKEKFNKEK